MKPVVSKKFILRFAAVLTLLTFFFFLIKNAGKFLVLNDDQPLKAPAFVCMGSIPDRALATIDLFRAGKITHIYVVEENMLGLDTLRKLGYEWKSLSSLFISFLIQAGVPDTTITLIPGLARSTLDEARFFSKWLKDHGQCNSDTILLITSAQHTRRAKIIFNHVLHKMCNSEIYIITFPSPYSGYNAKYWYMKKESIQTTLFEYIKLLSFFIYER